MTIALENLDHFQRRALSYLGLNKDTPLNSMPFVGPKSMEKLIKLGLVETASKHSQEVPYYRLTEAGNYAREALARLWLIRPL
jgi:hypothetical protein